MHQFVCDRNAMYDAGKEDYLRPSEHIGFDWINLRHAIVRQQPIPLMRDDIAPVQFRFYGGTQRPPLTQFSHNTTSQPQHNTIKLHNNRTNCVRGGRRVPP